MEPWGTPYVRGATEEDALPMATEKVLLDKYELNHLRAVSLMPTHFFSLFNMIV